MECGTEVAAREFPPSYRRAAIMQASLAILGFLASMLVWLRGNDVWWLVGGLLLVLVVPFTLIVIMPTNRKLLDPSLDKGSDATAKLFSKWAKLHRDLSSIISRAEAEPRITRMARMGQGNA
jgi:uncharacterized membrane protein